MYKILLLENIRDGRNAPFHFVFDSFVIISHYLHNPCLYIPLLVSCAHWKQELSKHSRKKRRERSLLYGARMKALNECFWATAGCKSERRTARNEEKSEK